jgi:hypothetical protein
MEEESKTIAGGGEPAVDIRQMNQELEKDDLEIEALEQRLGPAKKRLATVGADLDALEREVTAATAEVNDERASEPLIDRLAEKLAASHVR